MEDGKHGGKDAPGFLKLFDRNMMKKSSNANEADMDEKERFGEPVPSLVEEITGEGPGLGWKISAETLKEIEEIERHIVTF